MKNDDVIKHEGIITVADEGMPTVKILSKSACAACHAKGVCGLADMQEKVIEVENTDHLNLKAGDKVNVTMRTSLGVKAVLWGYLYPFLLVFITLFTLLLTTGREGLSALVGLSTLVPYYIVLSMLKPRFKKRFQFELEPFDE